MSLPTWTPAALRSETTPYAATFWRVVESQYVIATMKLVDTPDEQALLEEILEETKPPLPTECEGLHYLLSTPFRYRNRHGGSRFRPPHERRGIFYASEELPTALCEIAFWCLLTYAEAPDDAWPANPLSYTAFSVAVRAEQALDLSRPPLNRHATHWQQPADYTACWALAEVAREAGIQAIRYQSVRDTAGGMNLALFTCCAFAANEPGERQGWRLYPGAHGVLLERAEYPGERIHLPPEHFAHDPRLRDMRWDRARQE